MTTPSEVKRQIIEALEAHKNKVWDKAIEEGWNAELATHAHWLHDNALEFTDAIRLVSSMEFPDEPEPNWCVYCNGNGFTVEMEDGPNLDEYQKECRKCNGTGITPAATAPVTKELECKCRDAGHGMIDQRDCLVHGPFRPAPTPVVTREMLDRLIARTRIQLDPPLDLAATVNTALQNFARALLAEIEQKKYEAAMDDFERHTTPGGTWIMEDDSDD